MAEDFERSVRREVVPVTALTRNAPRQLAPLLELVDVSPETPRAIATPATPGPRRARRAGVLGALTAIAAVSWAAAAASPGLILARPAGSAHRAVASAVHGTTHGVWSALPTFIQEAVALLWSEARSAHGPTTPPAPAPAPAAAVRGEEEGSNVAR
jgi:hypothetical protein